MLLNDKGLFIFIVLTKIQKRLTSYNCSYYTANNDMRKESKRLWQPGQMFISASIAVERKRVRRAWVNRRPEAVAPHVRRRILNMASISRMFGLSSKNASN